MNQIMNPNMDAKVNEDTNMSISELLARTYGPYAFGAVILLAIWFVIVRPELANRAIDFQSQQQLIKELGDVSRSQQSVAYSLTQTAQTMKITATTLERVVERLEIYSQLKREEKWKTEEK